MNARSIGGPEIVLKPEALDDLRRRLRLATADGAVMLDLSHMRGAWVDAKHRIVHAQGGCLLGDVDRETQLYGLAAVLGFVSLTGITGLTLGGGMGYLTRRWGWTVDTVVG